MTIGTSRSEMQRRPRVGSLLDAIQQGAVVLRICRTDPVQGLHQSLVIKPREPFLACQQFARLSGTTERSLKSGAAYHYVTYWTATIMACTYAIPDDAGGVPCGRAEVLRGRFPSRIWRTFHPRQSGGSHSSPPKMTPRELLGFSGCVKRK